MAVISNINLDKSRVFINRLARIGRTLEDSLKMIAIWFWLQQTWNLELITEEILARNDQFLCLVSIEAVTVFSLVMGVANQPITENLLKYTLSLSKGLVSIHSLFFDRESVSKGIADIHTQLCRVYDVGACASGSKSNLNPFAREWDPVRDGSSEDDRCLFLTFSNGFPLSESQLVRFFTRKFGECVERVYVHGEHMEGGSTQAPPLFGRVMFKNSYFPTLVLRGQIEAKYWVDRKPLWCKRFDRHKANRRIF